MTFLILFTLSFFFLSTTYCDIYLHNPRGSNNRNRGNGVNTENPNRLFDSQNNNKGGYCWGPPMTYYEGSLLQIEWTNQHGCGVDHPNVDCDLILQYMCSPTVRDGFVSDTITVSTKDTVGVDPKTGVNTFMYGMHEPYEFYQKCKVRERNRGLFSADQGVSTTDTAMRTRQENNQNDVHGFECEEERDYYPYWHPTPWRDIAILTSDTGRCSYFKKNSQNVLGKFECSVAENNNEKDCVADSGQWSYVPPWNIDAPDCIANGFSRDNHLGNSKTGFTSSYNWVIPKLSTMDSQYINTGGNNANCVFRIRYNISTGDYAGWGNVDNNQPMIDSSFNDIKSPVQTNPYVPYGTDPTLGTLRLALNTDQYGRTFQDRSFAFYISTRPSSVPDVHRIINLNVRGKRGNIVEAYPAVEYDFTPNQLQVNIGDFVHFQWTGCDTNPNYAGEGVQGTDRSNIVQIEDGRKNYPMDFGKQSLFDSPDKAFMMAHLGQYGGKVCATQSQTGCCKTMAQLQADGGDINQNPQNCMKLNDPSVQYFDGGPVQMKTAGTYNYMSTRNNNFSNRSQKGAIIVEPLLPTWGIVLASIGCVGFVSAAAVAGGAYYAATHPASVIATMFVGTSVV